MLEYYYGYKGGQTQEQLEQDLALLSLPMAIS
jgi:hypothetical protein